MPINCKVNTSEETPVATRVDQKPAYPKGLDARKGSLRGLTLILTLTEREGDPTNLAS